VDVWREHCEQSVYEINVAKFIQKTNLLKTLMDTEGLFVMEGPLMTKFGALVSRKGQGQEDPGDKMARDHLARKTLD
jgi:predicted NAD-dependent protein-ADP-ribosyltransferase YbiA (DUF1768 family)